MPFTTGRESRCSTMLAVTPSTPPCDNAVTAMRAPSAPWAIACSMSLVRCFAAAPNSTLHWRAKKALAKR
jgi:hypothetical protein